MTHLSKNQVKKAVDGIINTMFKSLINGQKIEIRNYFSLSLRLMKPRLTRNPKTGEKVKKEARYLTKFKASKKLISAINKQLF